MFGLGAPEIIVIGVIVLILFGAKRLPDIGKGLGGAIREFKSVKKELNLEGDEEDSKQEGKEEKEPGIEGKIAETVAGRIPGVKKVINAKKTVDKVSKLIK